MINAVVGFVCDAFDDNVRAQLVRDLIILRGEWDFAVNDSESLLTDDFLEKLGLVRTRATPTLLLVYKAGPKWPKVSGANSRVPKVERDLAPRALETTLDPNPAVGYYLPEQGRDGANRTEQYLNRMHPKGKGIVNPLIQLNWG